MELSGANRNIYGNAYSIRVKDKAIKKCNIRFPWAVLVGLQISILNLTIFVISEKQTYWRTAKWNMNVLENC